MISGVRLTQLDHGEPLLGTSLTYNGYTGVQAAEKRLEKLFSVINFFGFDFVIDTINPEEDANGTIHLNNNGLYGHIWSFEQRMIMYRKYQSLYGFRLVIEVNPPSNLNESNWKKYAEFIKSLMLKYNDISYWQICDQPETVINQQFKCDPVSYVKLIKSLYNVKLIINDLQLGAPGVFQGLIDFYNGKENCWLNVVIGDVYKPGHSEYEVIGNNGILDYIDFFSIHGRQETSDLRYDIFGDVINKLKTRINEKIGKNINIFSINQGRKASGNDQQELDSQCYYEIKELLNAYKNGVFGFKNQLIDEYSDPYVWGGYFNDKLKDRGLLYYHLNDPMYKPAANTYQFILNALKGYNYVGITNKVTELDDNLELITLYNGDPNATSPTYQPTKSVTIVWSKTYKKNYAVLTPHYAREYMVRYGEPISLTQSVQIDFDTYDFIIVYETLEKDILDIDNIKDKLDKKLTYAEKTMIDLISSLPNSYNKEITDINYYKLLRSLSLELSDAKVEIHKVKHNSYLEDVENDFLYKNFGVLVGLNKKSSWDDDKYRRLVKGVTKSLLDGPTLESITEAVKLFTNFEVNIKELYKDSEASNMIGTDRTQFVFALEIEKPLDVTSTYEEIISDVDYVIDIVKPAHVLRLIIISLVGTENYREQYEYRFNRKFQDSDVLQGFNIDKDFIEGTFGWRNRDYDGQVKTAGSEFIEYDPLINGGLFLGPRYLLFDDMTAEIKINYVETIIKDWLEELDSLLSFERDETYHDIEDSISKIEAFFNESEHKFGLDVDNLIQLRGRKIIDGILVTNKVLNKYKLGFCSKLKDELKIEFNDFNSERYVFRNLINPFIWRGDKNHINPGFNHFPFSINGKFSYSQDILANMHHMFNELYLTDDKKENMEDQETELSFFNEEHKFGIIFDKVIQLNGRKIENGKLILNKTLNNYVLGPRNRVKDFEESIATFFDNEEYLVGFESKEELETVEQIFNELYSFKEEKREVEAHLFNFEQYRKHKIEQIEAKYVKYIKKIIDKDSIYYIYFPNNVMVCLDYYYIDVYVNGKMLNKNQYTIINDDKFKNYCKGIKFNYHLNKNDVVILSYFQNRRLVLDDFPIEEEWNADLSLIREEKYKSLEEIEEEGTIEYINLEKLKDVEEYLDVLTINSDHCEKIKEVQELLSVELPQYSEDTDFKNQILSKKRFMLCRSKLNGPHVLLGNYYEKEYVNQIEVISFESFKKIEEEKEPIIVTYDNIEVMKKPVDVIVFYLDGEENNIVQNANIIDEFFGEYSSYEKYDKAKDNLLYSNLECNVIEQQYNVKNDNYSNLVIINNDELTNFKNSIIDKVIHADLNIFEKINKPEDEYDNLLEKYNIEDNINKAKDELDKLIYKVNENEIHILQDNLNKAFKFNNTMKFVGEGKVIDHEQIIDNNKVMVYRFPYKPIIDYISTNISINEKYNSKIINNKLIVNNNNFYHEKYYFKEDTFEFS